MTALATPAAPRSVSPARTQPTVGRVIAVGPGDNLQAKLDTVQGDDIFVLEDGARWKGNFKLRPHPGTAWIMSRAAYDGRLPRARLLGGMEALLARLDTPNSGPALSADDGVFGWEIIGLELAIDPAYTGVNYGILSLGWGNAPDGSGKHVAGQGGGGHRVERCLIHHGSPNVSRDKVIRGIMVEAEDVTIQWNRIPDVQSTGADAQGIWSSNGKGPVAVIDNFIAATGQCIMTGGGAAQSTEYVPADWTIERNTLAKLPRWNPGLPQWDRVNWTVKPTLEFKMIRRARVIGNTLESSHLWPAFTVDAWAQYASNNGISEIIDVEIARNTVLGNTMGVLQIWSANAPVKRVKFWNNLALGVRYACPGATGPTYARGTFFLLMNDAGMEDVWIEQNTADVDRAFGTINLHGPKIQRLRVARNVGGYGHGGLAVEGSWEGTDARLATKVDGLELEQNALVDFGDAIAGKRNPLYVQSSFAPPRSAVGEWIVAGLPAVAGIDPATGRLTETSALRGLGVDFEAMAAAQVGGPLEVTPPSAPASLRLLSARFERS